MEKPIVSIIIPHYNYSKYLRHCLESIKCQRFQSWETVIVDDYSDNFNRQAVHDLMKEYSSGKFKYIFLNQNKGYSNAKNIGIQNSIGEYITHIDADDMLTPESISSRMVQFQHDKELMFCWAEAYKFIGSDSYDVCIENRDDMSLDKAAQVHAQTWMLKRSVYEEYGLYMPELKSKSDKEMLWRLGLCFKQVGDHPPQQNPKVKAKKIKDVVAFYRRHNKTMLKMRADNSNYNKKIQEIFDARVNQLETEGVTKKNTLML